VACSIGFYSSGGVPSCTACTSGVSYGDVPGLSACKSCNQPTPVCLPGTEIRACNVTSNSYCTPCAIIPNCIYSTNQCYSNSIPSCICVAGMELVSGVCQTCKRGYFKTTSGMTMCTPWTITTCTSGYYLANGTAFADSQCIPCPGGPLNAMASGCAWSCNAGFQKTT